RARTIAADERNADGSAAGFAWLSPKEEPTVYLPRFRPARLAAVALSALLRGRKGDSCRCHRRERLGGRLSLVLRSGAARLSCARSAARGSGGVIGARHSRCEASHSTAMRCFTAVVEEAHLHSNISRADVQGRNSALGPPVSVNSRAAE